MPELINPVSTTGTGLDVHKILFQFWGYASFRPLQEDVIQSVLQGKDTLALMPTGGGKSVCYQVPGLAKKGLCLVVSPLIALMKDQVENLRKKNITAYAIYSGMSRADVINTLKIAVNSNCKFLYVSPERLETTLFKEYLPALDVSLIAVDEAHCISQWGYDFRPPYLRIAALREEVNNVPILALTASATQEVQNDICDKLQFHSNNIFRQSFERANLSYSVFRVDSEINKIMEILRNVPGSAIVYCKSRKKTTQVADLIRMHGISADFYHAGLKQEERNRKQEEWVRNETRVMVCTNAFGMGIDKPDVRVVVHSGTPDCLENYYQEAGRAGRDGKRSYAVLLHSEKDIHELENSVQSRFPSIDKIRQVYQAISNYLHVASNSGRDQLYDFDIADFIKKFKLRSQAVMPALKALEQDGWLSFNEQVLLPSTARFAANKDHLYQFEKDYPHLEPIIKALLRSYEGIFEYPASISENVLARLLKKEKEEVKKELAALNRFHIIEYTAQTDGPRLSFLRNRIRSEDLSMDMESFNRRKEKYSQRTHKMIEYLLQGSECRSRIIASYFGDHSLKDCGICDNCLKRKNFQLTRDEFDSISSAIITCIEAEPVHTRQLLERLKGIKKEKAWEVINFLQAENKIEVDGYGWLRIK